MTEDPLEFERRTAAWAQALSTKPPAPTFDELSEELMRAIGYAARGSKGDAALALTTALERLCNLHANGMIG